MNKINSLKEYKEEYRKSIDNPAAFWSEKAESFTWKKKWEKVLNWEFQTPQVEWFIGGQLNITENCSKLTFTNFQKRDCLFKSFL